MLKVIVPRRNPGQPVSAGQRAQGFTPGRLVRTAREEFSTQYRITKGAESRQGLAALLCPELPSLLEGMGDRRPQPPVNRRRLRTPRQMSVRFPYPSASFGLTISIEAIQVPRGGHELLLSNARIQAARSAPERQLLPPVRRPLGVLPQLAPSPFKTLEVFPSPCRAPANSQCNGMTL